MEAARGPSPGHEFAVPSAEKCVELSALERRVHDLVVHLPILPVDEFDGSLQTDQLDAESCASCKAWTREVQSLCSRIASLGLGAHEELGPDLTAVRAFAQKVEWAIAESSSPSEMEQELGAAVHSAAMAAGSLQEALAIESSLREYAGRFEAIARRFDAIMQDHLSPGSSLKYRRSHQSTRGSGRCISKGQPALSAVTVKSTGIR